MKYDIKTTVISVLFLSFTGHCIWQLAWVFIQPTCSSYKDKSCIKSLLPVNWKLQMDVFITNHHQATKKKETIHAWQAPFDYKKEFVVKIPVPISDALKQNSSLVMHVFVQKLDHNRKLTQLQDFQARIHELFAFASIPLTKWMYVDRERLMLDYTKPRSSRPVPHIKTRVSFEMFVSEKPLPMEKISPEIFYLFRVKRNEYFPILVGNFLHTKLADLKEVTMDDVTVDVEMTYKPISMGKLRVIMQMRQAVQSLMQMGMTEKDIDSVKDLLSGTNIHLLCLTFFIGSVHMLLDILAFKNDIVFWKNKNNIEGLSSSGLIWRAFSQLVVFLYLLDEGTTMIVLAPCFIATLLEIWKLTKITRVKRDGTFGFTLTLKNDSAVERETQQYDRQCMRYISYVLYPLCLVGAVYSLVFVPQKSWYSWFIHSTANGVYAFGFLFMLPQLFINYRLKSVAALPWRAFMYKAFNTFIDDLFAFIITMPTAHRMACFRDDIVFLIYLYQRWLYPVDSSRLDDGKTIASTNDGNDKMDVKTHPKRQSKKIN